MFSHLVPSHYEKRQTPNTRGGESTQNVVEFCPAKLIYISKMSLLTIVTNLGPKY